MRMRKKPNLVPRMERCAGVQIKNPSDYRGLWLEKFPDYRSLSLEVGCGKGKFTVDTARLNPGVLLVAIEKVADAMVVGMERAYEAGLENVRFLSGDVQNAPDIFAPGEVSRLYINFCDPWPKNRDAKHRLTSPDFLALYRHIMLPGGEIHFKTDNLPLFKYSLRQFENEGFELRCVTYDLHKDGPTGVMTDYESKFYEQGIKINRCVAIVPAEKRDAETEEKL